MNSGIYLIKNMVNGKVYIGSTNDLKGRKHRHFVELRKNKHHNPHLQASFNKYGEKNFEYYIIAYCSKRELLKKEDFYINYFRSIDIKYGYNIKTAERRTLSEESKRKISISVKRWRHLNNWYHSEETKNKISLANRGKNNPNYGKHKSNDTKRKISESLKRSPLSNLNKPMSEEQKLKLSRSVSKAMKNIPKSEKHKINLSISLKKFYASKKHFSLEN